MFFFPNQQLILEVNKQATGVAANFFRTAPEGSTRLAQNNFTSTGILNSFTVKGGERKLNNMEYNVFIAVVEPRVQCLKHSSSWKLPTCMTLGVFRETTDSVFCIGVALHKQVSG